MKKSNVIANSWRGMCNCVEGIAFLDCLPSLPHPLPLYPSFPCVSSSIAFLHQVKMAEYSQDTSPSDNHETTSRAS